MIYNGRGSYVGWEVTDFLLECELLVADRVCYFELHYDSLLAHHGINHMHCLYSKDFTWCTTSLEKGCKVVELRGFMVSFTCFKTAAWIVT